MKLQYLGHSCFKLESEGYEIVLDPYEKDSVPGLNCLDVEADQWPVQPWAWRSLPAWNASG